jgi:beta-galactosidase
MSLSLPSRDNRVMVCKQIQNRNEAGQMTLKYGPINPRLPKMLHGADYNPDQWRYTPEVWQEDMRLMKAAHCNVMAVNIFGWSAIEPEEGKYDFSWLDETMDNLAKNNAYAILATPSGAKPAWLSAKYPEVLRVGENRIRNLHGGRHNHCFTSPVYRDRVLNINNMLAVRYKDHPALLLWHVSNEYGGECHCELCQEAFRNFLKEKYNGDLEKLNKAWWTGFWSHTYTDWSQIESPALHGETEVHGHNLDWKRFVTHQTINFYKNEIIPLRKHTPNVPITTNFDEYVRIFKGADYWKFAPHVDVISWDNYPYWHGERTNWVEGSRRGFIHDMNRSLKGGKPFMMMESSPSATNWQPVGKLRRPGMHALASMQAVAHGSDTVQYFQWRKSRGSSEKFHGAVVDHCGHENTRVFREVAALGAQLEKMDAVVGTSVQPEVAVIYDWENFWGLQDAQGPRREGNNYFETSVSHYQQFWKRGIPVDVVNMDVDFSKYKVVIAPMLYMLKEGVGEKIDLFVKNGGTFITTYWSGIVDNTDLCFLGGFPGPLKKVFGIWSEEIDALYDEDVNYVKVDTSLLLNMQEKYDARVFCDLIHLEGAQALAHYDSDFYKGYPAVTVNSYGAGKAYYVAFRGNDDFLSDFFGSILSGLNLKKCLDTEIPEGVTAQMRGDGEKEFIFLQNYADQPKEVQLKGMALEDLLTGDIIGDSVCLPQYSYKILVRHILISN